MEVIFRVKWIFVVSQQCYKSGLLKLIGQFSHDVVGCKTGVKFVTDKLRYFVLSLTANNVTASRPFVLNW